MFDGYRVVCVTPAGRRRYMKLLAPLVLASDLVDRYDIWVNTADAADLAFLEALARLDDRVRLVRLPDGVEPGMGAICEFFRVAQDEDSLYVRLDDDVVWLEPGFFETLLTFRIAHPRYFLVMPLIINNALCSSLLQSCGKIRSSRFVSTACMDRIGWRDAGFAVQLHRMFIDLIRRGETHRLHCGPREIALNRFSINALCWFGRDMAAIGGEVRPAEEEDLSNVIPTRLGRANCFCTDTIAAHFAFYVQRGVLDRSDILDQYAALLAERDDVRPLLERTLALTGGIDAQYPPVQHPGEKPRPLRWIRRLFRRRRSPSVRTQLQPGPLL